MGLNIGARMMEVGHTMTVWEPEQRQGPSADGAGESVARTPGRAQPARFRDRHHHSDPCGCVDGGSYDGPGGILRGRDGQRSYERITVAAEVKVARGEKVRPKGGLGHYVECTVSGAVDG